MTNCLVTLQLSGSNTLACRCGSLLMFFAPERFYITCASCGAVVLTIEEKSLTDYAAQVMRVQKNLLRKYSDSSVSLKESDNE